MINITLSVRIRPRVGVRSEGTKPLLTLDANLLFFYGLLAAPQFPVHSANTLKGEREFAFFCFCFNLSTELASNHHVRLRT